MPAVSLPNEHGGYITVAGASVVGALLSPAPLTAVAAGLVIASAFFARGPLDRRGTGKPLRAWDRAFLGGLALVALLGVGAVARQVPFLAVLLVGVALALVLGSSAVRRLRRVHEGTVELLAMSALAGSSALVALAGGAALETSVAVGLLMVGHVAASVPLVRSEILPQEQDQAARAEWKALGACVASAVACAAVANPMVAVCLLPRVLQVVLRRARGRRPRRPPVIGAEETVALCAVVALAAWTLGGG